MDASIRRFASYRAVRQPTVGHLDASGFDPLPPFRWPHFTVRLDGVGERCLAHVCSS